MASQWGSQGGFILATIGAAVGLGNIWRFSYVAGENGGAVFLLIYLVFVVLIGLPLMIAEIAIGRRHPGDAVSAFEADGISGLWRKTGWPGVISAVLIASYYAVVAGWAFKYFAGAVSGDLWQAAATGYGGYFDGFIAGQFEPVIWQALALGLAAAVVAKGIKGGIERVNILLMPVLVVIILGMAGFAMTLPGSGRGAAFLLAPDWSAFGRPAVYLNALGQAFFSLGVGVAVFVTYGGYLGASNRIPSAAVAIVLGDTAFAILAGVAIFGTVFALGGDPAAGPKLAFITFPQILMELPGGRWIGMIFFFLLSAAALTSMVALLEVPVACLMNRAGWPRLRAVSVVAAVIFLLGLPSALGYGVLAGITLSGMALLDAIDHAVSNFLLPVSGLLIALLAGWHLNRSSMIAAAGMKGTALGVLWIWSLRVLVPVMILLIIVRSLGLF